MKRLVVKVGSNVLTRNDGTLDVTRVSSIVDQIAGLRSRGFEIVLVTSGAVACGRSILGQEDSLDGVEKRQVYSAVGQVRLMELYHDLFNNYGIRVGQILTMKESFMDDKSYSNQKGCVEAMLRSGVLPIVNENDTVSVTELMFTDNDELSGLMAVMIGAGALVILSNVDGIYDSGGAVIRKVMPGEDISGCITSSKSSVGRGGMLSKYNTACSLVEKGIRVCIANGKKDDIMTDIVVSPESVTFTEFVVK